MLPARKTILLFGTLVVASAGCKTERLLGPQASTDLAARAATAPTDLMASAYAWRISLWWQDNSWQDGPTKENGFRLERCEQVICNDEDFSLVAITQYGWNFYDDAYVVAGTTYTYRVRAFNSAGASEASNEASATACFVTTDPDGYYVCVDPETLAP